MNDRVDRGGGCAVDGAKQYSTQILCSPSSRMGLDGCCGAIVGHLVTVVHCEVELGARGPVYDLIF